MNTKHEVKFTENKRGEGWIQHTAEVGDLTIRINEKDADGVRAWAYRAGKFGETHGKIMGIKFASLPAAKNACIEYAFGEGVS